MGNMVMPLEDVLNAREELLLRYYEVNEAVLATSLQIRELNGKLEQLIGLRNRVGGDVNEANREIARLQKQRVDDAATNSPDAGPDSGPDLRAVRPVGAGNHPGNP